MDPLVSPLAALTAAESERTARHRRLPQLGDIGQRRLAAARVVVLGAGGIGGPTLLALAAAGIGTIGIVDDDVVEASNLQRQLVHGIADVGRPKADSAADAMLRVAPEVVVERHPLRLDDENADAVLGNYDLIVDGTDNFETRYLADRAAARLGVPLVWAAVLGFDAQLSVFWADAPGGGTRLIDLFPSASDADAETCASAGVLGPLCMQLGGLAATEVVKLVTGVGAPLLGRVLVLDALRATQREVAFVSERMPPPAPAAPAADASTAKPAGSIELPQWAPADPREATTRGNSRRARAAAAAGATASSTAQSTVRGTSRRAARMAERDANATASGRAGGGAESGGDVYVSPDELAELLLGGQVLLDVRENDERVERRIAGSVHVPLAEIDLERLDALGVTPETPVVVHCLAATRSLLATRRLRELGFTEVAVLAGGIEAWARTQPIETGAAV